MQIKRLRLSGFKSFVDPVDLRVEPGLTGVVGPNGCGKSNLLEALRWTMGEASAKSLRGAGMEDVIFAGTATRPARDFAEVSILAEIAGEETEIVRRIERSAGSAYRIDGRDVRAKDVALLFADSATGAHSPALVSQNRIGAVIAARPADRRAMLEEAAGIAGLHVRRKDAEQKLRATEANLQRLGEAIADQEARATALRRQARQAERYRMLTAQIRVAEARTIFARWRDAAAAADAAKTEARAAETRVADAAEAQRAAAADQTRAGEALTEARAAALAARDLASEAGHRLAALRAEQASVERRLAELTDGVGRIAADREREGGLAKDAAAALDRLTREATALEADIACAVDALPALQAALTDTERAARDGEVTLAQALARRAGEAADARIAEAALEGARARERRLASEVDVAERALTGLEAREPIERERDATAETRRDALAEAERAREGIAAADHADRDAAAARDAAQASRAALGAELAVLDAEAAALTAARAPGDRRMLERIVVAPSYERAVAAALGDDLDFGDDVAADTYWAGAAPLTDDPVVAADALAPHVEAPAALARRLAQVIVLDTDDGRALATGQRLVTRAGAMRRWDGFVAKTGAGAAAERLERRNRLTALAALRPAAATAFAEAERAADAVDRDIAAARAARQGALDALARADASAREALQRGDRAAALLERLAGQRSDIETRLARAKADRSDATGEAERAKAALAALPDPSATTREVAALQQTVDERRAAAAEARAELATQERAAASARERRAAADADARSWRARADDARRRIADLTAREAESARDREALSLRPAELDAEITALAADHETARASADTLAANEHTADAALRSAEIVARDAGEALAAAREARAGAVARAENHELRRVETGRLAGERFECPAPVLPEKLGFDGAAVRAPEEESSAHEKLMLDRDRIGPVNLVAEAELAELEASAEASAAEREELSQAVNRLRGSIGTLNREGRQRLLAAFEAVDSHFRRLFTTLFEGGSAHLALIDSDDPLEAGLEIMAQPPGKRLQSLTLLSGGEQALTAIALIFALFLTNPAPICVLDEVDAPLDDANIERFCDLLDRMTEETATRYLIVTHNAVTMSRMHRLFGVTMIEKGVSRLVSVDLGGAEALAAE